MSFLATPSGFRLFLATLPILAKTGKSARGYATISLRQKHQDFSQKWMVDVYRLKLLPG
jgi:hypothetical protein